MSKTLVIQRPVKGKTFSLFGDSVSSAGYYDQIRDSADECIDKFGDIKELLAQINKASERKVFLRKLADKPNNDAFIGFFLRSSKNLLTVYTREVNTHLKELSLAKKFDSTLSSTEEQYHLYMLEIELTNRIFAKHFKKRDYKLAFLPHCLHDLDRDCRAESDGIDYVCKSCSKKCFINNVYKILRSHEINPYIWMTADLKRLFKNLESQNKNVGVLGIACIPELVRGMRLCMKLDVPVVGIPLNANRCRRWMGRFYETSVNLEALNKLLD